MIDFNNFEFEIKKHDIHAYTKICGKNHIVCYRVDTECEIARCLITHAAELVESGYLTKVQKEDIW